MMILNRCFGLRLGHLRGCLRRLQQGGPPRRTWGGVRVAGPWGSGWPDGTRLRRGWLRQSTRCSATRVPSCGWAIPPIPPRISGPEIWGRWGEPVHQCAAI